jgi:hypothetical protein
VLTYLDRLQTSPGAGHVMARLFDGFTGLTDGQDCGAKGANEYAYSFAPFAVKIEIEIGFKPCM